MHFSNICRKLVFFLLKPQKNSNFRLYFYMNPEVIKSSGFLPHYRQKKKSLQYLLKVQAAAIGELRMACGLTVRGTGW